MGRNRKQSILYHTRSKPFRENYFDSKRQRVSLVKSSKIYLSWSKWKYMDQSWQWCRFIACYSLPQYFFKKESILAKSIGEKNKGLQRAALIAESAIGISKIIINTFINYYAKSGLLDNEIRSISYSGNRLFINFWGLLNICDPTQTSMNKDLPLQEISEFRVNNKIYLIKTLNWMLFCYAE